MRHHALLATITLLSGSALGKSGDSFNATLVAQGATNGRIVMLDVGGKLLMNADQLARTLSNAGRPDASHKDGFRVGFVPFIQPGGSRFAAPAWFAARFGLQIHVDQMQQKPTVTKRSASKAPGTSSTRSSGRRSPSGAPALRTSCPSRTARA